MTTITFGSGGTYANLYAAWVHLDGLFGGMADDYTVQQVGDCEEFQSEWKLVNSWDRIDSNTYNITIICPFASSHQGNVHGGHKITMTKDDVSTYVMFQCDEFTSTVTYSGLRFKGNGTYIGYGFGLGLFYTTTQTVKNCIFDTNGSIAANLAIGGFGATGVFNVENCIFCDTSGNKRGGITVSHDSSTVNFKNITIYGVSAGLYFWYAFAATLENVVSAGCNSWDWGNLEQYSTYCADSDGTLGAGTGNIHNIVPADAFESVDPVHADFLKLKVLGALAATVTPTPTEGEAPLSVSFPTTANYGPGLSVLSQSGTDTGITSDIGGLSVPGDDGLYSIGCHEAQLP